MRLHTCSGDLLISRVIEEDSLHRTAELPKQRKKGKNPKKRLRAAVRPAGRSDKKTQVLRLTGYYARSNVPMCLVNGGRPWVSPCRTSRLQN